MSNWVKIWWLIFFNLSLSFLIKSFVKVALCFETLDWMHFCVNWQTICFCKLSGFLSSFSLCHHELHHQKKEKGLSLFQTKTCKPHFDIFIISIEINLWSIGPQNFDSELLWLIRALFLQSEWFAFCSMAFILLFLKSLSDSSDISN